MQERYKLVLCNAKLYKEIEVPGDTVEMRIGTSGECDVRLRRELFFSPIEIVLSKSGNIWSITCADNLYFSNGDVRKLFSRQIRHGDEFTLKYQETETDVFSLAFSIDFDYQQKLYDFEIDISQKKSITVGGQKNSDIIILDNYIGNDSFTMVCENGAWKVKDNDSRYGILLNGTRISSIVKLKDSDFISIAGFSFYYKDGKLSTTYNESIKLNQLAGTYLNNYSTHFEYPKFNRNTRIQYQIPQEKLEIQQAAQMPKKSKRSLIATIVPSLVMLAVTIVLRGIIGGGGTFVIYSAISMGMGIGMSIVNFFKERKEYKEEYQNRIDSYNKYIEEKRVKIEASRDNELRIKNLIYESLDNSIEEVDSFGKRLFERTSDSFDFLQVYLGKGRVPSLNPVKFREQEFLDTEDPLATIPETVSKEYEFIENAPIVSNFKDSCGVGVVANHERLKEAIKNMTLDIAIRHFYHEVKLVYILDERYSQELSWIRWLRNVDNEYLDLRNIVCDEESKNVILEDLYMTLSARDAAVQDQTNRNPFSDHYVVFVTSSNSIANHPVSKYLKNCEQLGFTFVFFEEYEENLPLCCDEIIRLDSNEGHLVNTENGDISTRFDFKTISDRVAEDIALKLGAIEVEEVSLEGELTKNITLFEMLGILSVDDIDLTNRWAASKVHKSLAAPLGVKNKNQVVYLDISDKAGAHGPHGLVAGTTGSGKSEILQTYILSLATLFHPYEVGFVLIDFKGGGMANQFKSLPHLIGTITNIDGREINRSLLSIKAELIKRQELFSQSGVNHINDYIQLYKQNKVSTPLPHLIMIVDEFAELKAEYPDFMKELISTARIGRTLGVHLILATQKPAGVVDAQIWSNSKFKLCLKVQTKEDSNEVLKTPLAAEIVEPGRAYFQVGNNEIFELFQSAYSGANVPQGNESNDRIFAIYEKNMWGKKKLVYTNKKQKSDGNKLSQLQAIVNYVNDYCKGRGIKQLPGICLPSLPNKITTKSLDYSNNNPEVICVPVGYYDDPEQQAQGEILLDLSKDNTYIVGSAQMGKTVLLQTILYGLVRKYTPDEVNIYIVDCGSMVLKMFENSKHVGGVVLSNEEEKCINLFKYINTLITRRKKILSSKGVGNYNSYIEAGGKDIPLAVVVIDNIAAFKEYFPNQSEELPGLAREAQGVGISFVFTAVQSGALSYKVQANFGKKIVLNCNDPGEYSNTLGHCKETPRELPGSGLVVIEKRILEYQTAIFGESSKEAERSIELKEFIDQRNKECSSKAVEIPMVPEKLPLKETIGHHPELFKSKGIIPIGMEFTNIAYNSVNLLSTGFLSLIGDNAACENFVRSFANSINSFSVYHEVEATVIDEKSGKLDDISSFGCVRHYCSDANDGIDLILDFCEDVISRIDDIDEDDTRIPVLIINSTEVLRKICSNKNDCKTLCEAIKNAPSAGVFILIGCIENQAVGFNSNELLKVIKDLRQGLLFAPLKENKLFEVNGRIRNEISFNDTMAYRFEANNCYKIKMFDN